MIYGEKSQMNKKTYTSKNKKKNYKNISQKQIDTICIINIILASN